MENIKILGVGCAKHKLMLHNVRSALDRLKIQANIEEIEDVETFFQYNISIVPTLLINNQVIAKGRTPSVEELVAALQAAQWHP